MPTPMPSAHVVPFDPQDHVAELTNVIGRVRSAGGLYPPPQDTPNDADTLAKWLMNDASPHRWTALVNGLPVGHVMLGPAHPYITDHLVRIGHRTPGQGVAEVARLFVDPARRGHGLARELLTTACAQARREGLQPVLAVVETFTAARALYATLGFTDLGTFNGTHGVNHVLALPMDAANGPARQ